MRESKGKTILLWSVGIFVLAFLLRFYHIAAIHEYSPFFDILPGDLGGYDRWATRIVEQGWLGKEVFYQDPLYPYFLALLYKTVGRDFFWVYTIQAFLGACTAQLLVFLGCRIFNMTTGVLAGLLYALYTPAIFFDGLLLKVTLSAFLFTLAIYLFLRKDMAEASPALFFSGLFFGLACLTRANFLLLLPVFPLAALFSQKAILGKRLVMALLFTAGVAAALGPVLARNYYVGGEIVLTTSQGGQNFYIGHNPKANGTYIRLPFVRPDPLYEQEDFRKEAEKRVGRSMTPPEVSRYWFEQSMEHIRAEPLADLKTTGRKLLFFLNRYEIPDNHNFYFHQRYSEILQKVPVDFTVVGSLLLLGFLGMLCARRTSTVFLLTVQLVYMASVIMFYVFSRYRMPILPLFCLTAAYGFFVMQGQFRMGQWARFGASLVILGLSVALVHHQAIAPLDFSHSYTDAGIAYEMKGEDEKALDSYARALEINPEYLRGLKWLAKLQMKNRDYTRARITYRRILKITPDSVDAKYQLMWMDKKGL